MPRRLPIRGASLSYRASYSSPGSIRVVPQARRPGSSVHADNLQMSADRISPKPRPGQRPLRACEWRALYRYRIARPEKWLCRVRPRVRIEPLHAPTVRFRACACGLRLRTGARLEPNPRTRLAVWWKPKAMSCCFGGSVGSVHRRPLLDQALKALTSKPLVLGESQPPFRAGPLHAPTGPDAARVFGQ